MIVRKAFKFRLKPSDDQLQKMHEYYGHCCFLWNKLLSMNLERLENKQKQATKAGQAERKKKMAMANTNHSQATQEWLNQILRQKSPLKRRRNRLKSPQRNPQGRNKHVAIAYGVVIEKNSI